MKTTKTFRKSAAGFTLIELMVVVGIIAIALIAVINRYTAAKSASQVNTEVANIQTIATATRNAFGSSSADFSTLSNTVINAVQGFPAQMVSGTAIMNSWGGAVTVGPAAATATKFQIAYAAVPTAACVSFINAIAQTADSVFVGTTAVKPSGGLLVDTGTVVTNCAAAPAATVTTVFSN